MVELTSEQLKTILSGAPEELAVHLHLIDEPKKVNGDKVKVYCHCLTIDGNGKIKLKRLAEFMSYAAADYAIPRQRIKEAQERDEKYHSTIATAALCAKARSLFTDLAKTGEGGEMLLFLLAERFLRIPHVICKMDLKTDTNMHYHGADGVYADVSDGTLKLFWGESKVYKDPKDAIRDCIRALKPFLIEEDHLKSARERDLILLSDKADLGDPKLCAAFHQFFDKTSPQSNKVEYCGIALIGFEASCYPKNGSRAILEDIAEKAKESLEICSNSIDQWLKKEKLDQFYIHFLCVPFPNVDEFRDAFRDAMGVGDVRSRTSGLAL